MKIGDDILVYTPDMPTLLARVRVLLTCMREHGVKLSRKKMLISDSVKFAGFLVTLDGVRPYPRQD